MPGEVRTAGPELPRPGIGYGGNRLIDSLPVLGWRAGTEKIQLLEQSGTPTETNCPARRVGMVFTGGSAEVLSADAQELKAAQGHHTGDDAPHHRSNADPDK